MILGRGIKDTPEPISKKIYWREGGKRKSKTLWSCPYYSRWVKMFTRCYCENHQKEYPSYIGCTVCEEWGLFSNFRSWCKEQERQKGLCIIKDKLQVDKDIMVKGNKEYSPERCLLIPNKVNSFILRCDKFSTGTVVDKRTGNIFVYCRNPFTNKVDNLGKVNTIEEGHSLWVQRKKDHVETMVQKKWIDEDIKELLLEYLK